MEWLTEPGTPAGQRNVRVELSRVEISVVENYEDRWDLLTHPSSEAGHASASIQEVGP